MVQYLAPLTFCIGTARPPKTDMSIETATIGVHRQQDEQLIHSQLALINNPEYSDLVIHCCNEIWHCHQAILFQRCPILKQFFYTRDNVDRILLVNESIDEVNQLLEYTYTLQLPKFLPKADYDDYEAESTSIWISAANAYRNGLKFGLQPLKEDGLEAFMFHGPRLSKTWDELSEAVQKNRLPMVSMLYTDWEGPEIEAAEIRCTVLKGLVRQAHKMADSPHLRATLTENQTLMIDYMWTLSRKVRKRKRKARKAVRGGRDAPIVIS